MHYVALCSVTIIVYVLFGVIELGLFNIGLRFIFVRACETNETFRKMSLRKKKLYFSAQSRCRKHLYVFLKPLNRSKKRNRSYLLVGFFLNYLCIVVSIGVQPQ